jgi:hypothetical protein
MIYVVMGRGIEGCGVTKFSIELSKYFQKKGIEYRCIAFNDKKWTRRKSHAFNIEQISLENEQSYDMFINRAKEECDTIIINSLPSSSHSKVFIDRFKQFLKLNVKFVLIQHDHASRSIQRNECLKEAIEASSVCFSHSKNNYFTKMIENNYNSSNLASFFDDESTSTPIHTFQPAFDFDECRSMYWKDINETDPKHHKWIGRTAHWKGFALMLDWHNQKLRQNNLLTTLEGIETGIVYPDFLVHSPHHNFIKSFTEATRKVFNERGFDNKYIDQYHWHAVPNVASSTSIAETNTSKYYGDLALVFGIYKNDEILERLSRVGFGYQLSLLKKENIDHSIEYTHCEVVAVGAIPVFHKQFGTLCRHRVSDVPLIDCKDNGTVWLDENNFDDSLKLIQKLQSDSVMRNEWREMAFEFYKGHQDSMNVFDNLMEKIL